MIKKHFGFFTMFVSGLFFVLLGTFFILDCLQTWNWVYITFVIGISLVALIKFANLVLNFRKLGKYSDLIGDIIVWGVAVVISTTLPNMFYVILPRLIGCWIMLHAFIKAVVLFIKIKDHLSIELHSVLFFVGDLFICFFLIVSPSRHETFLSFLLGMYFIIYGGNALLDLVRELLPVDSGNRFDEQLHLSVPPVLSVLIPPHLLRTLLDKDKEDKVRDQFNAIKKDIKPDMEVMIHLAPNGPAMLGHADLVYRGFVISYGCYDPHNRHLLGTMGDGVVLIAQKESYIYNCLMNENKVLVSFGIVLNDGQKERLNNRLIEVFSKLEDFESDEQLKQAGKVYKGDCSDYISRVTRTSPESRFYKIREGKLKTFFVVSSNCVFFMSTILRAVGFNLFDLSGIISPGAYYDFLNRHFKSNKGFVVSRTLYRKKDAYMFKK